MAQYTITGTFCSASTIYTDSGCTTLPGSPIVSNLTFVGQFGCP